MTGPQVTLPRVLQAVGEATGHSADGLAGVTAQSDRGSHVAGGCGAGVEWPVGNGRGASTARRQCEEPQCVVGEAGAGKVQDIRQSSYVTALSLITVTLPGNAVVLAYKRMPKEEDL